MKMPGVVGALTGAGPFVTNPSEAYAAALAAGEFRSGLLPDEAALAMIAVSDLAYPRGDRRIPKFPNDRALADRLQGFTPTLPDIHLVAARLDVDNPKRLVEASQDLVRRRYGVNGRVENPAPYLWGLIIDALVTSPWRPTTESGSQLATRFASSYDRIFNGGGIETVPRKLLIQRVHARRYLAEVALGSRAA
jgi:hypothetical protein